MNEKEIIKRKQKKHNTIVIIVASFILIIIAIGTKIFFDSWFGFGAIGYVIGVIITTLIFFVFLEWILNYIKRKKSNEA